ncbi:MAG: DNA translocase FtsK [Clostridia bacterium]|nr:DNA translocase FtsK [Clostridia bacterium]
MNGLGRKKEDKENKNLVFTRETLGVVLILFATLMLVCLITREKIFSIVGQSVNAFLFGLFGFFAYAVLIFTISLGVLLVSSKSVSMPRKRKVLITLAFVIIALISHVATISSKNLTYGQYISASYAMGAGGIETTSAGGFFTALVAYVFSALLTDVGSYVILGIALAAVGYGIVRDVMVGETASAKTKKQTFNSSFVKEESDLPVEIAGVKEYPVEGVDFSVQKGTQKLFVNNPNDFAVKTKREINRDSANPNGMKITFAEGGLGVVNTADDKKKTAPAISSDDLRKKLDYIKTPGVIDMQKFKEDTEKNSYTTPYNSANNGTYTSVSGYVNPREREEKPVKEKSDIPFIEHDQPPVSPIVERTADSVEERAKLFGDVYASAVEVEPNKNTEIEPTAPTEPTEEVFRPVQTDAPRSSRITEIIDIPFIDESEEDLSTDIAPETETPFTSESARIEPEKIESAAEPVNVEEPPAPSAIGSRRIRDIFGTEEQSKVAEQTKDKPAYTSRVEADNNSAQTSRRSFGFTAPQEKAEEIVEEKPKKEAPPINREYFRPPLDLLETYSQPINAVQENHQERMEIIQKTLEDFHINAVPQSYVQGPSITRYEIMMPAGISVKKVLNYDDDLKMRLAAKNGVRIEAPIPGKNLVGIEVANSVKVTVGLKEVMEGLADKKVKPSALMFALGKDIVGNSISDDLAKGPHYLIAGATGSGKSVCLHVMLVSMLMRYSPEELKLVLVDPKSVEFRKYEHIPHLLVDEIITEPKRALALLQWAYEETDRRNAMFTSCGGMISNIDDYNSQIASDTVPKLPRIVFIIDELADLMEACKKDLEARIRMIAAKSRSAGIHLVLATQRPSVDVITGTIKANLPSRIALKVMNYADSQTILSEAGAEKLLGNGDMLYKNSSMGDYERYQGAYISGREITNIVNYIKEKNTAYFDDDVQEFLDKETKPKQEESVESGGDEGNGADEINEFFLKALWLAVNTETISISLLQRRFQIGYARAGGLVDKMERMGFVSGNEGSKARRVLLSKEEFVNRFGPMDEA